MQTNRSMSSINQVGCGVLFLWVFFLYAGYLSVAQASEEDIGVLVSESQGKHITTRTILLDNGSMIDETIIHGPPTPPPGYEVERSAVILPESYGAVKTLNVPAFNWVFGCSAVSGAMIAGYYDRNGFPNMYAGPTNGGVMPLNNNAWPTWSDGSKTYPNLPLAASRKGVDGTTVRGSIDDYWVKYGSGNQDPYIAGGWAQHAWSNAIGDYMKTSQSAYGNTDGSTVFYNWTGSALPLTCADMVAYSIDKKDGTYGRKLFYEARGYKVTDCYNQNTDNIVAGGFSFARFKTEIDAGRPVMLNLEGHTVVGVGYDDASKTVYLHDTWDYNNHTMTWGGSYAGMRLLSVSIVNLAASTPMTPVLISPTGSITDSTPTFKWKKVTNATQYRFQVLKGSTVVYTKDVASSACGTTECANTPATVLSVAAYTWRAAAYVSGSWKSYSGAMSFNVSAPAASFNSQFNGSITGWSAVKGNWANFSSMYYRSAGLANNTASAKHTGIYGNATYEVKMKRGGTCTSCANHIIIRGKPTKLDPGNWWMPSYVFQYENNGYFSVFQENSDGSYKALKGWASSAAIVKNGWNTLKVVANGSSLKYYINNQLVWSGSSSAIVNGQVGFGFYRNEFAGTLDVDWAKLTILAPSASVTDRDENRHEKVIAGREVVGGTRDQSP